MVATKVNGGLGENSGLSQATHKLVLTWNWSPSFLELARTQIIFNIRDLERKHLLGLSEDLTFLPVIFAA